MRTAVFFMMCVVPFLGMAQTDRESGSRIEYEKTTVVNFDYDVLEGGVTGPDGEIFWAKPKTKHSGLIEIRKSWRSEIIDASGDL